MMYTSTCFPCESYIHMIFTLSKKQLNKTMQPKVLLW